MASKKVTSKSAVAALQYSQDTVVKTLADVKLQTNTAIDNVANLVLRETGVLREIQEHISSEKAILQELFEINTEATSLAEIRALKEAQKLAWAREREAYEYSLGIERRNAKAQIALELEETKRVATETLETKSNALDQREKDLFARALAFETTAASLTKAAADAEAETKRAVAIATNSLKKDLENGFAIERLNLTNIKALLEREVKDLSTRVAELAKANGDLQAQMAQANLRVQEIANKAIEGAAQAKVNIQTTQAPESTGRAR